MSVGLRLVLLVSVGLVGAASAQDTETRDRLTQVLHWTGRTIEVAAARAGWTRRKSSLPRIRFRRPALTSWEARRSCGC
jgi:hypothetical protein